MRKILLILLVAFTVAACGKKDTDYDAMTKNAFLLYSASANNLQSDLWSDIRDIEKYYAQSEHKHIYVLYKQIGAEPILYRMENNDGVNDLVVVKKYDANDHTGKKEFLQEVIEDVNSQPRVINVTDLIISSHGSSWLKDDTTIAVLSKNITTNRNSNFTAETTTTIAKTVNGAIQHSIGQDYLDTTEWLDMDELAEVLEPYDINSIIFDACYMGSIEVFYELRNSAKYIVASPAEVLSYGMDYVNITKYLTRNITLEDLRSVAYLSYEYYSKYTGFGQSATFTVVETEYLEDVLTEVKAILRDYVQYTDNVMPVNVYYDEKWGIAHDYKMYLHEIIDASGDDINVRSNVKSKLENAWSKAFPYYYHTDFLFNGYPNPHAGGYDIRGSYGVAGYVYHSNGVRKTGIVGYYTTLDWGAQISDIVK